MTGKKGRAADARLIALCDTYVREADEFDALHAPYIDVVGRRMSVAEAERSAELVDRHHRLLAIVARTAARTPAGLLAKARMIERRLRLDCVASDENINIDETALPYYSLARDVLAMTRRQIA